MVIDMLQGLSPAKERPSPEIPRRSPAPPSDIERHQASSLTKSVTVADNGDIYIDSNGAHQLIMSCDADKSQKIAQRLRDLLDTGAHKISVFNDKDNKILRLFVDGVQIREERLTFENADAFIKYADNIQAALGGKVFPPFRVEDASPEVVDVKTASGKTVRVTKWPIRITVSGEKPSSITVMSCDSKKAADQVIGKMRLALLTIKKGTDPQICLKLDTSFNLIMSLNGVPVRSIDVKKTDPGNLGNMAIWAGNLKTAIGSKCSLDTRPLAQARLFKKAQPHLGKRWVLGVWDCTLFVHAMVPRLDNEGGDGNGPQNMRGHVEREHGLKPKSIAAVEPGDIMVKLDPGHGYLSMCVGKDLHGRKVFIDLENSAGAGTHTAVYVDAEKYRGYSTYVLDGYFLTDPFYTKDYGKNTG